MGRASRIGLLAAMALAPVTLAAQTANQQTFDRGPITTRACRTPAVTAANAHPVETENLLGFTLGSDIDAAGTIGFAIETIAGFDRREGRYSAANTKLEFSWAAPPNLSASLSLLGGAWNIANNPDLPDTHRLRKAPARPPIRTSPVYRSHRVLAHFRQCVAGRRLEHPGRRTFQRRTATPRPDKFQPPTRASQARL